MNIYGFIKVLIVISVVAAMAFILVPSGKMQKSFKYVISMFVITGIILSAADLLKTNINFNLKQSENSKNILEVYSNIETETSKIIIENILKNEGIKYGEIVIETDISDDYSINIKKAIIDFSDEKDVARGKNAVETNTGITVEDG